MTPQDEEIHDSPTGWVADHIRRYVETEGRQGHHESGVTTLLLTIRGRNTGKLRRTALIYGRDGQRYVVVASNGGLASHPAWYLNLLAHPEVHVQVGAEKFTARASIVTEADKKRLWRLMADMWPDYDTYEKQTSRDIPVVIIERQERVSGLSGND
jgi:deazaflavin-dependent oxidoreductase (nitroreductase family)